MPAQSPRPAENTATWTGWISGGGHRKSATLEEEVATELESLSPVVTADAIEQLDAAKKSCIDEHDGRDADDWFHVTDGSCAFLGRRDGKVTVNANSGGFWLLRNGPGDSMVAEKMPSAEAAVEAATAVAVS